jgi:hypothetical protein
VAPGPGPRTTEPSRRALARLREELAPALTALDLAAAEPWSLGDRSGDLRALQYALHEASERVHRLELGAGSRGYPELELALAAARDETADVVELLEECGPATAGELVWEWRVALFAVRLALHQLDRQDEEPPPHAVPQGSLLSLLVLTSGVAVVLGGALASLWPVWLLGLVLVATSTGLSHRRP